MSLDLNTYITEDLPQAKLLETRNRVASVFKSFNPEVDISPSTVAGALLVEPLAKTVAAFELAADCVLGDLDLNNLVLGNVCDCDFVFKYLKNFGYERVAQTPTTGIVNLLFNSNKEYRIPINTQFVFGENNVFYPLTSFSGDIELKAASNIDIDEKVNVRPLTALSENLYSAVVPVYGPAGALVSLGTSAQTDLSIPELVQVSMDTDIEPNQAESDLEDLIEQVHKTYWSETITTRGSAISLLTRRVPYLSGVSAVIPGDTESQRSSNNLLNIFQPAVDLYVKDKKAPLLVTQSIALTLDVASNEWRGAFNYKYVPVWLNKFYVGSEAGGVTVIPKIISSSKNSELYPNLSCAFSNYEALHLSIPNTAYLESLVPVDSEGVLTTLNVNVSYYANPSLAVVKEIIESPEVQPAIDVGVFNFRTCYIDKLKVKYRRKDGYYVNVHEAKTQILEYLLTTSFPEVFEESTISDILLFYGAAGVFDIEVEGKIYPTLATHKAPNGLADVYTSLETVSPKITYTLRDNYDLKNQNVFVGIRNIGFFVEAEKLILEEIKF